MILRQLPDGWASLEGGAAAGGDGGVPWDLMTQFQCLWSGKVKVKREIQ